MDNQKEPKKEEKRNTGRVILLIIALVCLIAGLAYTVWICTSSTPPARRIGAARVW